MMDIKRILSLVFLAALVLVVSLPNRIASGFTAVVVDKAVTEIRAPTASTWTTDDASPPVIINITETPHYPQPNERVIITARVVDDLSGVKEVILRYRERLNYNWYGRHRYWGIYEWTWTPLTWNVYTDWMDKAMAPKENITDLYEAEMLELSYYSMVWYEVYAVDNAGNPSTSEVHIYNVVRGTKTIINDVAGDTISWFLNAAVGLVLVRGLGKGRAEGEKRGDTTRGVKA